MMNTIISFSGGRTSGMMLHHILQQHGGRLPENPNPKENHEFKLPQKTDCYPSMAIYPRQYNVGAPVLFRVPEVELWSQFGGRVIGGEIKTPEGKVEIFENDWIIRGVKGEYYPCKPDVFAASYEPA